MNGLIAASPLGLVARWSTRSQEEARRNAMAACTVLAARRLERVEVEEFIAGHLAARTANDEVAPAAEVRDAG
ncbi:MAG: hypothetical protein ACJ72O_10525 [Marmoricola sp.]|jgi:hypothetical protein